MASALSEAKTDNLNHLCTLGCQGSRVFDHHVTPLGSSTKSNLQHWIPSLRLLALVSAHRLHPRGVGGTAGCAARSVANLEILTRILCTVYMIQILSTA